MKKIFNFTFVLAMILGSASCSDDDVNNLNEWSAIYVGIERPSLSVSEESFTLKHSAAEGIETFSFPVTVKLSRMATQDITATLSMVTECPEAWSFENPEIVIPAGEITATTTVNGDWSFANEIEEAKTRNSQVVVSAVAPTSIARVSSTLGSLNVTVNKLAIVYENVEMKTPSGTQFDDASSWVVYVDGEKNSKLTDGDLKNYAYELNQMEVVIDFGDERTLTGFCTKNGFGESYAPEKFTVSTSNDNTNWIVQQENIELPTDVVDYDFAFKESVTCRYLKLYITGARCLVSEIFVYGE